MCLYTAVTGNYEELNELTPDIAGAGIDKICFTDDPTLTSETWDVRVVKPAFAMDSVRSQRMLKILPHRILAEYRSSLYIDNSISLKQNPVDIINFFCGISDISVPLHSYRDHLYEEFIEVAKSGLDDPARIFEQMNHYQLTHSEMLQAKPYWAGIMIRNHMNSNVINMMETWYQHILRYSRRDQLSLKYAEKESGIKINPVIIDNFTSEYHQWPVINKRDDKKRAWSSGLSGGMDIFEKMQQAKELEKSLDITIHELAGEYAEIKEKYALKKVPAGFIRERYYVLNPDVAAAGMDAAQHYLNFGWREDRKWK
ncbi:glycosyltransferase domain-containing protein [Erwinia psidii]|nr:glycosyltransferase domain-containing protein [Erwinia psidii]